MVRRSCRGARAIPRRQRFDGLMELANCPFSKTASRLLTIRGHEPYGSSFSTTQIAMAGGVFVRVSTDNRIGRSERYWRF